MTPIQLATLLVWCYVDLWCQVGEKNTAASNVTQFVEVIRSFVLQGRRPRHLRLFLLLHGRFWMRARSFIDCFNFWESGMNTVRSSFFCRPE